MQDPKLQKTKHIIQTHSIPITLEEQIYAIEFSREKYFTGDSGITDAIIL